MPPCSDSELLEATRRWADQGGAAATKTLASELQSAMDRLFAGCAMQGQSQLALHVLLAALMPRVQAMRGEDATAAALVRDEAVGILNRVATYFE